MLYVEERQVSIINAVLKTIGTPLKHGKYRMEISCPKFICIQLLPIQSVQQDVNWPE